MGGPAVTLEVANGVAVVTMSNPPVNALAIKSASVSYRDRNRRRVASRPRARSSSRRRGVESPRRPYPNSADVTFSETRRADDRFSAPSPPRDRFDRRVAVLEGLKTQVEAAQRDPKVRAIVITGSKGKFSGGFDITQLKARTEGKPVRNMSDFNATLNSIVESGAKPTVAAIENLALGGGLEVAMACNARVATPKAQLGLPELRLGVIPGFGGTQRLPRLVGLQKALEMMLKSKPIKAEEALKLGLVDAIAPRDALTQTASKLALDIAEKRVPRAMASFASEKLPNEAEAKKIFAVARRGAKRVQKLMPHPMLCIDAIEAGINKGASEGLIVEQDAFAKAVSSAACKGLVHFFFASRGTAAVPGVTDVGLAPRVMKCVGVVGGGLMGSGIATACVMNGVSVVLKEINQKFLDAGMSRVKANLASAVKKGRLTQQKADAMYANCHPTLSYGAFSKVDMAIEAVIENLGLKQKIFSDLESSCRPDAILSTNTSTIDITKVAQKMKNPERIVGAHFFSPAHVMQLFEIIRTDITPPQVLVDTLGLSKQIKKTPVVVGNCTGFAVNRVFFPYTMSACLLLDLGCDPYAIDNAIRMFGMPIGPFRLSDLVGHDVGVAVGSNFIEDFPERVYRCAMIPSLVASKRLGEKSGSGFYVHKGKTSLPDPEGIAPLLAASRANARSQLPASAFAADAPLAALTQSDIVEMIFFPVVNEACRCLAEGVVVRAGDLDTAAILGMGFPPFRGGIVHWADSVGAKRIADRLREWSTRYGGIYQPCPYLEDCAVQGRTLSEGPIKGPDRSKL